MRARHGPTRITHQENLGMWCAGRNNAESRGVCAKATTGGPEPTTAHAHERTPLSSGLDRVGRGDECRGSRRRCGAQLPRRRPGRGGRTSAAVPDGGAAGGHARGGEGRQLRRPRHRGLPRRLPPPLRFAKPPPNSS